MSLSTSRPTESPPEPGVPAGPGGARPPPPARIVLELSRDDKEIDFSVGPKPPYRRAREDRETRNSSLHWTEELRSALNDVQGRRPRAESVELLARQLRAFLVELGLREDEKDIEAARRAKRRTDVVFRVKAHELHALPWELIQVLDEKIELGRTPDCLVQYEVPGTTTAPRERTGEGGRILFAWAGDVQTAALHRRAVEEVCRANGHPFDPAGDVLEHASPDRLRDALERRRPAVLHLLCHGAPLPGARAFGLALHEDGSDDETAPTVPIASTDLRRILAPFRGSLRLVVLCACWSSAAGELHGLLGSVAEELHEAGIQSVIASRFPLTQEGAKVLTGTLYRRLLGDLRSLQDAFLSARLALARDTRSYDWAAVQLFARSDDGPDLRPFVLRPYMGLLAFDGAHARYFFGREAEVEEAVRDVGRLLDPPAGEPPPPRLYVVTGASGRGKSSFVAAGLVPGLRAGLPEGHRGFATRTIRPSEGLPALGAALSLARPGELFLLVVDQLEEIFTSLGRTDAKEYVQRLWGVASDPAGRVLVLGSLRVDFLSRCGDHRLSGDLTLEHLLYDERHHVSLGPLTESGLARIIEEPARLVGLTLQEGLARRIVDDARDEPGTLPLVQHVLDELWRAREDSTLSLRDYEDRGGIKGAFEALARSTWKGLVARGQEHVAKRLFVKLVATQDDAEHGTRRVARRSDLAVEVGGDPGAFEAVLDELVRARLVVVRTAEGGDGAAGGADPLVEIAHEALIRRWADLRSWVLADRVVRSQLLPYREMAKREERIARGEDLAILRRLVREHPLDAGPAITGLLSRSEEAERRELERARLEKERELRYQIRHGRNVKAVAVGATLLAALAVGFGVWAGLSRRSAKEAEARAEENAQRARRESILSAARAFVARKEPVIAANLLLAIDRPESSKAWVDVAVEVLEKQLPVRTFRGAMAAVSPDGQWVATVDNSVPAVLVEQVDGGGRRRRLRARTRKITGLAWSPDGVRIALCTEDGAVGLWRVHDSEELALLPGSGSRAEGPVFSADGRFLAAIVDERARVWTESGAPLGAAFEPEHGKAASVHLGPDGRHALLLSGQLPGALSRVEVWTLDREVPCGDRRRTERPCRVATLDEDSAFSAGFSPDGWKVFVVRSGLVGDPEIPADLYGEAADADDLSVGMPGTAIRTWSVGRWASPAADFQLAGAELDLLESTHEVRWLDGDRWLLLGYEMTGNQTLTVRRSGGGLVRRIDGGIPVSIGPGGRTLAVTKGSVVSLVDPEPRSRRVDLWASSGVTDGIDLAAGGSVIVTSSTMSNESRLFRGAAGGPGTALPDEVEGMFSTPGAAALAGGAAHAVLEWSASDVGVPELATERTVLWDVGGTGPAARLSGRSPVISDDGRRVLLLEEGRVLVYDTHAPGTPRRFPIDAEAGACRVVSAAFDEEGKQVVFLCADGALRAADAGEGGPSRLLAAPSDCLPQEGAMLSAHGRSALLLCSAADARVLRPDGEISLLPLCDPPGEASGWALTADGQTAVCTADEGLVIFPLDAPDRPILLPGWGVPLTRLGTSSTGRRLWVSATDNKVRVLALDDPGELLHVAPHPQELHTIALDRAGKTLLTTSWDGWVRVHAVGTTEAPFMIRGDLGGAGAPVAALSADGKKVLVAEGGGTAKIHDLSVPVLRARLETSADCLTPEIRVDHLGEALPIAIERHVACQHEKGRR